MAIINGTDLDDPNLLGTSGSDTISGLGGRDHLYGGAGTDTLYGGAGDDAMHGDAGADLMFGGAGNDDYYVDEIGDVISETTVPGVDDGGNDRVYSTVSYTLSPFIERLVLLESALAISATGNAQVNSIVGNSNANIISGGGGKDSLTGGLGADTFVLGPAVAANTVTITDFAADDKFGITAGDYNLSLGNGLTATGTLDPTWFALVTGTQGTIAGHGQFLYNATSRSLMWDADGAGAAAGIALATLQTGATVTASQFAISGAASPVVGNIAIGPASVTEGNAGTSQLTYTVIRTGGTAAFGVNFATTDGTATIANSDYVAQSGTLNFADGQNTGTITVLVNGDTTAELDETVFVGLSGVTNGGIITTAQGTGTIVNDDSLPVVGNIAIGPASVTEGNAGTSLLTYTVTRTGGTAAFGVDFATTDGTATIANSDYVAQSGTLNFADGQTTGTITVLVNGDTTAELDETVFVGLSGVTNGGIITTAQGTGTIVNDDSLPVVGNIAIGPASVTEGNAGTSLLTYTVTRTGGTAAFGVDFATTDGTATIANSDYVAQSGTLNFADGQTTGTITVLVNGDTTAELDETVFVGLSGVTNGGIITTAQGTGTIVNDDSSAIGIVSINDISFVEGNSGSKVVTFTVSHTGDAMTVNYATANDTATTANADYTAATGTLSFAATDTAKTISVTVKGDTIVEASETFFVNLTTPTNGGVIVDGQGLATITNDDTPPPGPHVVAVHSMQGIGSWDPSGLAYDPATGTLYLVDSEVDEVTPRGAENLWALNLDGTLKPNGAMSTYAYTTEATGIAFDQSTGRLFITDDDIFKLNTTTIADPTHKIGQVSTLTVGGDDPEDVAFNPLNGDLFIANGSDIKHPMIIETDPTGTHVVRDILLPTAIKDPEAVYYDATHDVFFVGIENGHDIWMVDHNGNLLNDINIFAGYRNPVNNGSVNLKGVTIAPSSDPNDAPSVMSLYIADFGVSHVNDGRIFEIADPFWPLA